MDLHLGAPVTKPSSRAGQVTVEQALVQLRRRHIGDHGPGGGHLGAVGKPDAGRYAVANEDPLDVAAGLASAAAVADQPHQRVDQACAPAPRDRHSPLLDRDGDHLSHEPRRRCVRAEPRVEHPGSEQSMRALRREGAGEPVAARAEHVSRELDQAAAPEPAVGLQAECEAVFRPELGPEHREGKVGVREEGVEQAPPRIAVTLGMPVELLGVRVGAAEQEGGLAVRIERSRRKFRVQPACRGACQR